MLGGSCADELVITEDWGSSLGKEQKKIEFKAGRSAVLMLISLFD
jgi:hypothetical protein